MTHRPESAHSDTPTAMPNARQKPSDEGRPPLRIVRGDSPAPDPRGRVERQRFTIDGAVVLVAMTARDELVTYEVVRTGEDMDAAVARLWRLLSRLPAPKASGPFAP